MSSRRDFIKQAAVVTATALAGNSFLSHASAAPKKKAIGANNTVNTASTVLRLFGLDQPLSWTGEVPESIFE